MGQVYWFCHIIRTDASTIAARSAMADGMFPFFIVGTSLGLSFYVGRYLTTHLTLLFARYADAP
jgi:hypothetical protein